MRYDSTIYLYQRRLKEKINTNCITEEDTIDIAWDKIKLNIKNSAAKTLGRRRININATRNNKPWFTEEVKLSAEKKRKAYIKYKNNRTQEEYQETR